MKDEHRLYILIILVVVIFSEFLGVFDGLFKSNNTKYLDSQILVDSNNKYASYSGVGSNEQYSNPATVGVDGDLYAIERRRKYMNPKRVVGRLAFFKIGKFQSKADYLYL